MCDCVCVLKSFSGKILPFSNVHHLVDTPCFCSSSFLTHLSVHSWSDWSPLYSKAQTESLTRPGGCWSWQNFGDSLLSESALFLPQAWQTGSRRERSFSDHSNFCLEGDLTFLLVLMMGVCDLNGYKVHLIAVLRQKKGGGEEEALLE